MKTNHIKSTDIEVPAKYESLIRYANERTPGFTDERVPVLPYNENWVRENSVQNLSGVERRCAEIGARRSVKKKWQAAWLLKGVTQIDLTTLSGDDTRGKVERLCAKAIKPIRNDILDQLELSPEFAETIKCGAVCVYPSRVADAARALKGTGIPVASVVRTLITSLTHPLTSLTLEQTHRQPDSQADRLDMNTNSRRYDMP